MNDDHKCVECLVEGCDCGGESEDDCNMCSDCQAMTDEFDEDADE